MTPCALVFITAGPLLVILAGAAATWFCDHGNEVPAGYSAMIAAYSVWAAISVYLILQ
jgi:hypothetical protein